MSDSKILAGLAVFRTLYDSEKDIYEVIAAFLKEIIYEEKMYTFNVDEIARMLNVIYQFEIPTAVVSSSLKRIPYIERSNGHYIVINKSQLAPIIGEQESNIQSTHKYIISQLYTYIENETGTILNEDQKNLIQSSFCSFILDKELDNEFISYITGFIIANKNDIEFNQKLNIVREGVILHTGIRYNSDPSDRGAWKAPLTIFFDLEILFHLAGYNGDIYKAQAEELINYIVELNRKDPKITLKYFADTKEEIERFFRIGERIVKGKERINPRITAMVSITNGCATGSDIQCEKDDFYNLIEKKYKITIDKYEKYFNEDNHKYNIIELNDAEGMSPDELNSDYNSLKYINYVAIRRGDNRPNNFENIGYILLTGNRNTQSIASDKCRKGDVPLSTNIGFLINKIWFKLNKGLSKNFPQSFSIISKSQIILSKIISDEVGVKYSELKKEIKEQKISPEQAQSRFNYLRTNIKRPEDVNEDIVNDIYSFLKDDTESYLAEQEFLKSKTKKLELDNQTLTKKRALDLHLKDELLESKTFKLGTLQTSHTDIIAKKEQLKESVDKQERKVNRQSKYLFITLAIVIYLIIIASIVLFINNKSTILAMFNVDEKIETIITITCSTLGIIAPLLFILITGKTLNPINATLKIRTYIRNKIFKNNSMFFDKTNLEIENLDEKLDAIKLDIIAIISELKQLQEQIEKEKVNYE